MPTTYKAEPAEPILAHTLLQTSTSIRPETDSASKKKRSDQDPSNQWSLELDIENGLHFSPDDIFRPGTVIGFSRLRGRSPDGNDDEFVGELPRHLLTKWLRTRKPPSTPQSRTFIIHPPNSTIFSPTKLLSSLQTHNPSLPRKEAISLLDSVQLFPVFDFAAAVHAINEVADILHSLREHHQEQEKQQPQMTLVIAGLDTLTEAVVRASNAVRGAAVLSSALRTITQLSRMHALNLSILLVNTSGVGPTVRDDGSVPQNQNQNQNQNQRDYETRGDVIQSMFCVTDGPLFPSLLMRTLDQGIDTHLLVSSTRRVPVLEVIKDRVGGGLGRWCVWSGRNK
ncbi:uncharacterized protein APUU_30724A [Aspergillus puulaauensis]|uniref:DNA recombination and repair protein Rad51-like C-terminal domain-containing protein n=1 Tax=Aspergillus puulaauensis TaxID=1220207 RepID=A0A7R7XL01_9EURO|nr:uncharacterized protein APUU_30724A [Aspergillus puulaauensis]BCS22499.1 hypothetical protein APUU_30724A [Aspergillus puulaauensis]